jgi:hypothetical protein
MVFPPPFKSDDDLIRRAHKNSPSPRKQKLEDLPRPSAAFTLTLQVESMCHQSERPDLVFTGVCIYEQWHIDSTLLESDDDLIRRAHKNSPSPRKQNWKGKISGLIAIKRHLGLCQVDSSCPHSPA